MANQRIAILLLLPRIVGLTFGFSTSYDSPIAERTIARCDCGPLAVSCVIVTVDDHPIASHFQFVGAGCVGVKSRVVLRATLSMQHRQPGLPCGIEALRSDARQLVGLGLLAVFPIHV